MREGERKGMGEGAMAGGKEGWREGSGGRRECLREGERHGGGGKEGGRECLV